MPTQDITAAEVGDRFGATMTQPVQRGERLANGVFGRVGRELACESDDPDPRVVKQRGERPVGLIRRDTSAPHAEVDIDMDVQAAARDATIVIVNTQRRRARKGLSAGKILVITGVGGTVAVVASEKLRSKVLDPIRAVQNATQPGLAKQELDGRFVPERAKASLFPPRRLHGGST